MVDGQPDRVRVRAAHITDTDISELVAAYPAPDPLRKLHARPGDAS